MKIILILSVIFCLNGNLLAITEEERQLVWKEYVEEISKDEQRALEFKNKALVYKDKTMKYEAKVVGKPDEKGMPLYIALHGGGQAPQKLNDSQWEHMKIYYLENVKQGVYVATRGVTNTWNLHFVEESYPLYDRMIENMVAFGGVDPNRIYIMGFSAGGDGTYQIAARMADRWAGAAMSAGHHNSVSPRNLYNLPMLLQVGDNDRAVNRNKATVEYAVLIQKLLEQEKSGYKYQLNVHFQRGHNFLDNHPKEVPQKVIENPFEWLAGKEAKTKSVNTSSINWLKDNTRNPVPERVIWDTKTNAAARGVSSMRHYWLGVSEKTEEEIISSYQKDKNLVVVEKGVDGMLIFLNKEMADLEKPLTIQIAGQNLSVKLNPSLENLRTTLKERGDKSYMFEVKIKLTKKDNAWSAESL